ncbi:MAG: PolC-type DNA polymerase III [Eubacterium sp.]|jgi:DNA polymerase-3 subunit alpha (Gram-positive type)
MNSLLELIDFEKAGVEDPGKCRIDARDSYIDSRTGVLKAKLDLNFVIPFDDLPKIKDALASASDDITDVQVFWHCSDAISPVDKTVAAFLPYAIKIANGEYVTITRCIIPDKVRVSDGVCYIGAMGKVAAESLNAKLSGLFCALIKKFLSLDLKVVFENEEETLRETARTLEEQNEKDLKQLLEDNKARAEKAKKILKSEGEKAKKEGYGGEAGGGAKGKNYYARRNSKRNEINAPAQGDILVGTQELTGAITPMREITPESSDVTIEGKVFDIDCRAIKSGSKLVTICVTDNHTSLAAKMFLNSEKWAELESNLEPGNYVKIHGDAEWDTYDNMLTVKADGIQRGEAKVRVEKYEGRKRVELHCHTKMSAMDAISDVKNIVATAARWGQPAVAITDHGVVQSFPDAADMADKLAKDKNDPKNIKVIYGMEGYVFDDSDCRREDGTIEYKRKPTYHIILLAATQDGLKNLYKLVSISHLDYFYKRPRLPKSVLAEHREGLIIGSACQAGEVYQSIVRGDDDEELDKVASFYDYLEIQPLINNRFMIAEGTADEEQLRENNRRIIECGRRLGKLTVATTDAHYENPEDAIYRDIIQAGMGYDKTESGEGLYLRTTEEMLGEFSYLGEDLAYEVVVENTNKIADMVAEGIMPVPKGKYPPKIPHAEETLRDTCMTRAKELYGDPLPDVIQDRLDTELNSIIGNGYAVMYVSAQMLVKKSLDDGYLVGSRGSVGSSFAATMAGITEVNPLPPHYRCPKCRRVEWGDPDKYEVGADMPDKDCPDCGTKMVKDGFSIPFATFLGFKGDKEPDIDLNFAGEEQPVAHRYCGTIFGEKNVYKAGTVLSIKEDTAKNFVRKYAESRNLPLSPTELTRLAKGCIGVKRTTGQHPGGIVIVPDDHDIIEFCPVQRPANSTDSDIVTTHFDYHKIDKNLLKLDILGHNIPSMIRQLQDMTGIDPLSIDLGDKKVLSIFRGTEALDIKDPDYRFVHGTYAIPEFGTHFVRQMLDDVVPERFGDLVKISGFSHGTDVWKNNAQDYIKNGTATIDEVISTRDDIMRYLIKKGLPNEASFKIMEDVRKNRPLKEEQLEMMHEHGVPQWYIDSCDKLQYLFPRAHAAAYVMMSFRMAWFKVYYPLQFYATVFTASSAAFDADTIFKGKQACLDGIDAIAAMGKNATAKDKDKSDVFEIAYEMYARGYEFGMPKLGVSDAVRFTVADDKVVPAFSALEGLGESAAKSLVEAYNEKPFETVEEAVTRAKLNKKAVETLRKYGVFDGMQETDQISFLNLL